VTRPRLLDLCCGAGGAAMGYHRAGFDVVGIDHLPQPNYPFPMVLSDAIVWMEEYVCSGHEIFDAIHASPPCQVHVKGMRAVNLELDRDYEHRDLIAPTRELLQHMGWPYVIENVVGAPLISPIRLCGTSFDLPLRRHRLFESNVFLFGLPCAHGRFTEKRYWNGDGSRYNGDGSRSYSSERRLSTVVQVYGHAGGKEEWPAAMGIDWMTYPELAEAIPPAYTQFVGEQLMSAVRQTLPLEVQL